MVCFASAHYRTNELFVNRNMRGFMFQEYPFLFQASTIWAVQEEVFPRGRGGGRSRNQSLLRA
ncbi:MAG: hypothetical protein A2Z03_03125 [Chloroflexi bacterium RBG_16_56_8]|nr:MAG: hypothetical protein A2Z03_03125 [Chloroflexi bacterium RBG_16_56_8]